MKYKKLQSVPGLLATIVRNDMSKLFKKYHPNLKLLFIYKSPKQLSFLLKYKDCLPTLLCSNVIYKYSCSGCNTTYYGKTSRNLKIRCNKHLGISKSGSKLALPAHHLYVTILSKLAIVHQLDDFNIIGRIDNSFDPLIHESLLIQRDSPCLKSQQSSIPMVLF